MKSELNSLFPVILAENIHLWDESKADYVIYLPFII